MPEALAAVERAQPDLVVTDLTMAGRGGIDLIKDLLALRPALRILVCSMHDETLYAERALRAGAKGYVMKDADGPTFLAAIRRVLGGQNYMSEKLAARVLNSFAGGRPRGSKSPLEKLSDREFEVFHLFGEGRTAKEIAVTTQSQPENDFGASRPHQGEAGVSHQRRDDPTGRALRGDRSISTATPNE